MCIRGDWCAMGSMNPHHHLRLSSLFVLCLSLAACERDAPLASDDVSQNVAAAATGIPFGTEGVPGGIIAVARGDKTLLLESYGLEAFGAPQKLNPGSSSRIGSISKSFVATVTLQMVAEKKLALSAQLSSLGLNISNVDGITVEHLLQMKSGVADLIDEKLFAAILGDPTKFWTERELAERGLDKPRTGRPGETYEYSNTNYHLLTLIIEKLTGKPYPEAISERILKPLSLAKTFVPGPQENALPAPAIQGWEMGEKPGEGLDVSKFHPSYAGGAGSMAADAKDLLVFARAFGKGALVAEATLQPQNQPFSADNRAGLVFSYGYGTMRMGSEWFGHSGSVLGYSANMFYHPKTDTTVVMLFAGGQAVRYFKPIANAVVPGSL
jgi:D-alanyl-D-alanine carboxypeptidase